MLTVGQAARLAENRRRLSGCLEATAVLAEIIVFRQAVGIGATRWDRKRAVPQNEVGAPETGFVVPGNQS
jgi:hypothetical protein